MVGVIGDTSRRRLVMVVGGLAFAASAALTAAAGSFSFLLVALVIGNPATGAFVSLAQATLMDADPSRRVRNMARWTLAGSFGYVGGPILLVVAVYVGVGWRGAVAALAIAALPLTLAATRFPSPQRETAPRLGRAARDALAAVRRRDVLRLLLTLEAADLLLDGFHGFLALYLVDAAGQTPATAALGVGVWTGAGFVETGSRHGAAPTRSTPRRCGCCCWPRWRCWRSRPSVPSPDVSRYLIPRHVRTGPGGRPVRHKKPLIVRRVGPSGRVRVTDTERVHILARFHESRPSR